MAINLTVFEDKKERESGASNISTMRAAAS
jgi:hypothetical protein